MPVIIAALADGDRVEKTSGYPFPGEVRAVFTTRAGATRYVVEATGPAYAGMLNIFNGDQLRRPPKDADHG